MTRTRTREQRKAAFVERAAQMFEQLEDWYDQHPDASFAEIEEEARRQRRGLMGETLPTLINGRDTGYQVAPPACPGCQGPMRFVGYRAKQVSHLEGESTFERAYYVCPTCPDQTIFPPGPEAEPAPRSRQPRPRAGRGP